MSPQNPMSSSLRAAACGAVPAVQADVAAVIEPESSLELGCTVAAWPAIIVIVVRRELPPCVEVNNKNNNSLSKHQLFIIEPPLALIWT